jgi:hypothetical protein
VREWIDPSHVLASSRRATLSGLVVVGAMEMIVPLIVVLTLDAIPVLAMVHDLATSILGTKNVPKVFFILTLVLP